MRPALKTIRRLLKRGPVPPLHPLNRRFPKLRRNIFIITYGRSGSTLLQSLLNTIPGCQIRGENHNTFETIWASALRAKKTRGGWGRVPRPASHPWHGSDAVTPDAFAEALVDAFVANVLTPDRDARYFGFKEIRYDAFGPRFPDLLDFMHQHFKDPLFVFNTRDAEDVRTSAWWQKWNEEDVRSLVARMDEQFVAYRETHPDRTFMASYESFSTDPEALRGLFEMLDEPFDPARLQPVLDIRLTH